MSRPPLYISVDCETELIAQRRQVLAGHKPVNTSAFEVPRLSCVSFYGGSGPGLLDPVEGANMVGEWLQVMDYHLVFHNAPFDVMVLCKQDPELLPLFLSAYEMGRIHDTGVLYQLWKLSTGHYDKPDPAQGWATPQVLRPHLADLARELVGLELDKGEDIRLTFGQFIGCFEKMTERHRTYAKQDAVATFKVFEALRAAGALALGEGIQVRADFCGAMYDQRGVAVDRAEAGRLLALFQRDMPALERAVVDHGLGEYTPKANTRTVVKRHGGPNGGIIAALCEMGWTHGPDLTELTRYRQFKKHYTIEKAEPEFHLRQALVRKQLSVLIPTLPKPPKYTDTGLLSITADDWREYIPATDEGLQAWLRYEKLKKIIGTYLRLYSQVDEVFPRWHLLVRSGRRSSSAPNIQNIPKRKYGIRSLFVPRSGMVFVKADFSFQELVTLAEAMLLFGIKGPLYEGIQKGDPHTQTAALLTGRPEREITKKGPERQAAKAVNFGVPGGLGPIKLADYARKEYGVVWTVDEARDMRKRFLKAYPDIEAYLRAMSTSLSDGLLRVSGNGASYWKRRLGASTMKELRVKFLTSRSDGLKSLFMAAERQSVVELASGRIRRGCRFTEAANTYFQGTAADVTKASEWLALSRGLRVVLVVHDELVAECRPDEAEAVGKTLERCMLDAFQYVCPTCGPFAKVEVETGLLRWGAATDKDGKDIA